MFRLRMGIALSGLTRSAIMRAQGGRACADLSMEIALNLVKFLT